MKEAFDRQCKDRWIRDLGFDQLIPEAVNGLLDKYKLEISEFSKAVYPYNEQRFF